VQLRADSEMAPSSDKNRRSREQNNNSHGIMENWFVGDVEAMTTFIHEMRKKEN